MTEDLMADDTAMVTAMVRLHDALQATRLPGTEFLRLVTEQADSPSRPVGHSRAPRPSRRAKAKRST